MTLEAVMRKIRSLSVEERKRLIGLIVDSLAEPLLPARTRSILDYEGVAARLADDEDPQDHVKRLRDEWAGRP